MVESLSGEVSKLPLDRALVISSRLPPTKVGPMIFPAPFQPGLFHGSMILCRQARAPVAMSTKIALKKESAQPRHLPASRPACTTVPAVHTGVQLTDGLHQGRCCFSPAGHRTPSARVNQHQLLARGRRPCVGGEERSQGSPRPL